MARQTGALGCLALFTVMAISWDKHSTARCNDFCSWYFSKEICLLYVEENNIQNCANFGVSKQRAADTAKARNQLTYKRGRERKYILEVPAPIMH
ncbi:hypothetical protein [Arachidicoccus soli]|uniref:hypothetical protein n=1 Tax=Arachidicoccus soli TaxID=2341117 RepID=UPI001968C80B|nr:hypothetical protein [Arachidicoccus soli]